MGLLSDAFGVGDAQKAAKAAEKGFQEGEETYRNALGKFSPFYEPGVKASNRVNALLDGDFSAFREDPGYHFAFDEGMRAVNNSGAARGMNLSGAQLKALNRYGQGVADQQYSTYFNRLLNVSGQGQNAANSMLNASHGIANMQTGGANARASGLMAKANFKNYLASSLHESGQRIGEAWATMGMGGGG